MQPFVADDCYANDLGEVELEASLEGKSEDGVKAAYRERNYDRLLAEEQVRPDKLLPAQREHRANGVMM